MTDCFVSGAGITEGQDANDFIVYDTTSGKLYYDADGAGAHHDDGPRHLAGRERKADAAQHLDGALAHFERAEKIACGNRCG